MDIKIVSSLDKVFAHFGPTLFIEEYSMLKNERYHLQLCIYNDEWRKTEVKVEVKGSLSKYCQLRIVETFRQKQRITAQVMTIIFSIEASQDSIRIYCVRLNTATL